MITLSRDFGSRGQVVAENTTAHGCLREGNPCLETRLAFLELYQTDSVVSWTLGQESWRPKRGVSFRRRLFWFHGSDRRQSPRASRGKKSHPVFATQQSWKLTIKHILQGYEADNANIQLLRLRSFTIGRPISDPEIMAADAQHRIAALVGVMEPFVSPPPPLKLIYLLLPWPLAPRPLPFFSPTPRADFPPS